MNACFSIDRGTSQINVFFYKLRRLSGYTCSTQVCQVVGIYSVRSRLLLVSTINNDTPDIVALLLLLYMYKNTVIASNQSVVSVVPTFV